MSTIYAIIVAAGSGTRLKASLPKAFVPLAGRPLFTYSLDVLLSHPHVSGVVLVIPEVMREDSISLVQSYPQDKPLLVTNGGSERWESARNGVAQCPDSTEWVLIHDAARPFVTHSVIDGLLEKCDAFRAAFTATPEIDTVRYFDGDQAGATVDRSRLVRVGTPQLFDRSTLMAAFESVAEMKTPPTDEVMLFESRGIEVGISWGDPLNFKVTTPADMEIAEALIERRRTMFLGR